MKRIFLFLFIYVFFIRCVGDKHYIANQDIKVRKGKATNSAILGEVKNGNEVEVTSINGSWAKVRYLDQSGFVKTRFLKTAQAARPAAEESTGKLPRTYAMALLLGLAGLLFLVRRFQIRRGRGAENTDSKNAAPDKLPVYWYQCRKCKVSVRKESPPSGNGCLKGAVHEWTELAEVGQEKYFCRHCTTTIKTKSLPVSRGCPSGDFHSWTPM